MKKKVLALTLFLFIFGTGTALAEEAVLEEAVIDTVEEEALVEEIEEVTEEVEEILDKQEETINEDQLNEVIDEAIEEEIKEVLEEENIEDIMEEVEELEEEIIAQPNSVNPVEFGEKIEKGIENSRRIIDIVETQYNMKKQFVENTKEAIQLNTEIRAGLKNIHLEMKEIVKDENRTIDKDTYGNIRVITGNIKNKIRGDNYKFGTLAGETVNYVRYVFTGQFRQANKTFQNILILQENQLALLRELNNELMALNNILIYA